jgi:hypothetical protein
MPLKFKMFFLSIAYNIDLQYYNSISPFLDDPILYAPLFYGSDPSILHHVSASTPHI